MKLHLRSYIIILGCCAIIVGFFSPWFVADSFARNPTTVSGFQMWRVGLPDVIKYTPQMIPELVGLLWLLPIVALLTCALSILEMFNRQWDRRWIQLTAYGSLLFIMGLFIWPFVAVKNITWGLQLCIISWLFTLISAYIGSMVSPTGKTSSNAVLSSSQASRRAVMRQLVGLAAWSSFNLSWYLWSSRAHHQGATFTYQQPIDPTTNRPSTSNWPLRVSWSPDGKRILVGQLNAPPQSWDAFTGKNVRTYQPHGVNVNTGIWSPDGQSIALGGFGFVMADTVAVVDTRTEAPEATFTLPLAQDGLNSELGSFAWSPDGQYLGIGTRFAPGVTIWKPWTKEVIKTYAVQSQDRVANDENGFQDLAWSPDGQYLAAAIPDQDMDVDGSMMNIGGGKLTPDDLLGVHIWDAQSGERLLHYPARLLSFDLRGTRISWSPDSKRLACANDITVQILDLVRKTSMLTYTGHAQPVSSVAWSPDGKHLASGSYDWSVQVWDATTGALRFLYQGHSQSVNDVAWSPDGKYLASCSADGTVQVWQLQI